METEKIPGILKAHCFYCDKEIISLYEGQLKYNLMMHEAACKENPANKSKDKLKGIIPNDDLR